MNPMNRWFLSYKHRCVLLAVALISTFAPFKQVAAQTDPVLVGLWTGEHLVEKGGIRIRRWTIDRQADGRYSIRRFEIDRNGAHETNVTGKWWVKDGVLHTEEQNGTINSGAWRYSANGLECIRLQAIDGSTGAPLKPEERFGECHSPSHRPVPDEVHRRCIMDFPGSSKKGTMELRIAIETDGQRYATLDGERLSAPVEVREYPILSDFDPRRFETMTNAGEALLTMVQANSSARLGFDPRLVRSVRVYVLKPPRNHRPMEYFNAGDAVLFEAVDGSEGSMGMVMYMPFLLACPAAGI